MLSGVAEALPQYARLTPMPAACRAAGGLLVEVLGARLPASVEPARGRSFSERSGPLAQQYRSGGSASPSSATIVAAGRLFEAGAIARRPTCGLALPAR